MMSFVTRLTFAWKVWSGDETTALAAPEKFKYRGHRSILSHAPNPLTSLIDSDGILANVPGSPTS